MVWTVLFYVQNLLGIGHLHRASRISRALCQQGARVFVAFGGVPIENMNFGGSAHLLQLPYIYALNSQFTQFQTSQGGVPESAVATNTYHTLTKMVYLSLSRYFAS